MQAIKGYLSGGRFTPADRMVLPQRARVMLVIEEVIEKTHDADILPFRASESEKQNQIDWLDRVEALLEQSRDEDIYFFK